MKDFLEYVVKHIVNDPKAVEIKESGDSQTMVVLTMKVAPEDMGRVIGKSGKIINSLRTLVRIIAIKEGKRVQVDLEEVPGQERPVRHSESPLPENQPEEQVVLEQAQK